MVVCRAPPCSRSLGLVRVRVRVVLDSDAGVCSRTTVTPPRAPSRESVRAGASLREGEGCSRTGGSVSTAVLNRTCVLRVRGWRAGEDPRSRIRVAFVVDEGAEGDVSVFDVVVEGENGAGARH